MLVHLDMIKTSFSTKEVINLKLLMRTVNFLFALGVSIQKKTFINASTRSRSLSTILIPTLVASHTNARMKAAVEPFHIHQTTTYI